MIAAGDVEGGALIGHRNSVGIHTANAGEIARIHGRKARTLRGEDRLSVEAILAFSCGSGRRWISVFADIVEACAEIGDSGSKAIYTAKSAERTRV